MSEGNGRVDLVLELAKRHTADAISSGPIRRISQGGQVFDLDVAQGTIQRVTHRTIRLQSFPPAGSPDPLGQGCSDLMLNGTAGLLLLVPGVRWAVVGTYGYRAIRKAWDLRPVSTGELERLVDH